jgi:hypothetical protein
MNEKERADLAKWAETQRLAAGLSKEAMARKADVSSITYKRVEDGLPVRDTSQAQIIRALEELSANDAPAAPEQVSRRPDLTAATDDELLTEIHRRMGAPRSAIGRALPPESSPIVQSSPADEETYRDR